MWVLKEDEFKDFSLDHPFCQFLVIEPLGRVHIRLFLHNSVNSSLDASEVMQAFHSALKEWTFQVSLAH